MRACIKCGKPIDLRGHTGLCRQCWQKSVAFELKPEEAAYIAGLFDGEAHIAIRRELPTARSRRRNPAYRVVVEIAMTDRQPIDFINSLLPDAKIIHCPQQSVRRLPYYRLRMIHRQAIKLLTLILPYLKAKQEQAKLCLELEQLRAHYLTSANLYGKGRIGQCAPDEFIRLAEQIYWKLRSLHLNKKPRSKKAVERFI